jgi:hypothetical protein
MNGATIAMNSQAIVTPTALSWKFIRWARDAGGSIAVYALATRLPESAGRRHTFDETAIWRLAGGQRVASRPTASSLPFLASVRPRMVQRDRDRRIVDLGMPMVCH